jgi:hypothetical protein
MKLAPLLELASSPAFRGADESVGASLERLAAVNAVTSDPGVLHAICSATFCVHAFTVPIAPVPRRRTMAFPAAGRAAEMHPTVERELLEREPFAAPRALLLRDGLNTSHCFCDTFSAERLNRENLDGGLQASMFSTTPSPGVSPSGGRSALSALRRHFPTSLLRRCRLGRRAGKRRRARRDLVRPDLDHFGRVLLAGGARVRVLRCHCSPPHSTMRAGAVQQIPASRTAPWFLYPPPVRVIAPGSKEFPAQSTFLAAARSRAARPSRPGTARAQGRRRRDRSIGKRSVRGRRRAMRRSGVGTLPSWVRGHR